MIVMTLNVRGLASKPKKLAIYKFVVDQSVDVLFLQETMGDGGLLLVIWNYYYPDGIFVLWMLRVNQVVCLWVGKTSFSFS